MLKISLGTDDFKEFREENGYFVDKSLLIKEVIDGAKALLLPRPRRFGKTLNLSMLRYFFEKSDEDRSCLFQDLAIARAGESYLSHLGRYPVLALSLKDIKGDDWNECYGALKRLISQEYARHDVILDSLKYDFVKDDYASILKGQAGDAVWKLSLKNLISHLYDYHGQPVVVLIDEYDSPILEAFAKGYYKEMIQFMRAWLSGGLKHERGLAVYRAVVTGILRVAKESIFSGINNLVVWSTLKIGPFSNMFGFTEEEVRKILLDFGLEDHGDEVRSWYNGYMFGNTVIYNPWSVMSFIEQAPNRPAPHWVNTASNVLIHQELESGGLDLKKDLEALLAGEELRYSLTEDIVFEDVLKVRENIWSFLYFAGYLRAEAPAEDAKSGRMTYRLSIPNREVREVYHSFIRYWHHQLKFTKTTELLDALLDLRLDEFEGHLQELVLGLVSVHDVARYPEAVYHAFVLGLFANLGKSYEVRSNPESGYGRADIILRPKTKEYPKAFIIELKSQSPKQSLDAGVSRAFKQIEEKAYETPLLEAGVLAEDIYRVAIVVQGKQVKVVEWRSFSMGKRAGEKTPSPSTYTAKKASRSKRSPSKRVRK